MTAIDDLRYLSTVDRHHGRFVDASDGWFERSGFITLSEQARDGAPLVAVNLRYPEPCFLDPAADMHIVHWLANLEVDKRLLAVAFVRNIEAINVEMGKVGATQVWGMVPKSATHLTDFLDRAAAAGACKRIDGADVNEGEFEGTPPEHVYFYIGLGQDVTEFVTQ